MAQYRPGTDADAPQGQAFRIRIGGDAAGFACRADQTVLNAMITAGRAPAGIERLPVGCRGGGCGVCRVQVTGGRYDAERMSAACVTAEQADAGIALACRIRPRSDLTLLPAPLDRARRCEARAA